MNDNGHNNKDRSLFSALPMWAQGIAIVGVPSFIALALLGFIPGIRSPIDRLETGLIVHNSATAQELEKNRDVQRQMVKVLRAICYRMAAGPNSPKCED